MKSYATQFAAANEWVALRPATGASADNRRQGGTLAVVGGDAEARSPG